MYLIVCFVAFCVHSRTTRPPAPPPQTQGGRRLDGRRRPRGLDVLDGLRIIGRVEHRRAGNERVGARLHHLVRVVALDAAVHLNPEVQALTVGHGPHLGDLLRRALNKRLAAKARVDRHDQHQVAQLHDVLEDRHGGGRVEDHARRRAEVLDELERAVEVDGALPLGVDRDDVRASLDKVRDEQFWLHNHQVHVEHLVRHGPEGVHNQRANRNVGHKPPVHHVHVHPVAAGHVNGLDLVTELGKIRRQDGGGDNDLALGRQAHLLRPHPHARRRHRGGGGRGAGDASKRAPGRPQGRGGASDKGNHGGGGGGAGET
ncbi:hypothetical protein BU14_0524s0004 [Porphyra umbilicalis]|uniref:Secreted protein n=1 Tax=Porphyra umbilicalis TaxID=2786 RepID=A0A1X6NSC7_PORUM|nr:hypothetical protein BU14_0524s0004 [Porphyra umbilicalis]|eukprot:OSX71521.1 hypothetical protein BU14_0524s0004 [Porphyra umbilicalis]